MFWILLFAASPGGTGGSSRLLFFPRGMLWISRARISGALLSWLFIFLFVCSGAEMGGGQGAAEEGSGLCVRVSRWLMGQFCSIVCSDSQVCRWTHLLCCLLLLLSASYFLVPVSKFCLITPVVSSLFHFLSPRNSSLHSVYSHSLGHGSCLSQAL